MEVVMGGAEVKQLSWQLAKANHIEKMLADSFCYCQMDTVLGLQDIGHSCVA